MVPRTSSRRLRGVLRAFVAIAVAVSAWTVPAVAGAATFQVICTASHQLADDPIIFPGQPGASHMHLFLGNEGTDANSSYDQMVAASTTCGVASDTSGYWVPSVVVDGLAVDPFKLNAYYGSGPGVDPSTVSAFPADLRIVAGGDTTAPGPKSAVWSCQGQGTRSLPVDCGSRKLRAHIKFPNCWDGSNLDSANHRSHLAYSTRRAGCPSTHPVPVPALTLVLVYPITDGTTVSLSSGAAKTLHADFWNTWDQAALESFTQMCIVGAGGCGILRDPA